MHAGHKDIILCGSLLEPLAILGNSLNWWINVWSLSNKHRPSKVKCALHCQMWQMSLYIFPFSSFPSLASKAQTSEQLITATGKNSVQLPSEQKKTNRTKRTKKELCFTDHYLKTTWVASGFKATFWFQGIHSISKVTFRQWVQVLPPELIALMLLCGQQSFKRNQDLNE